MNPDVHNTIKIEYEKRQKLAHDSLMQRRSEVYAKIPEIEKIENEIKHIGIKYNKMILLGAATSVEAASELEIRIEDLKKQKQELLVSRGYIPGFLEISYQCPKCNDTGFIEGGKGSVRCSCYSQLLINQLFRQSNLKLIDNENFSTFNEKFYPDVINESVYGIKKSPYENINIIKEKCIQFVENFTWPEEKNLFFFGPTGVGKTFMANCIAAEILNQGRTVLYQTAPLLFDTIGSYKIKNFKDEDFEDAGYKNIFEVELLIIDDLGTESQSSARYAELLNILNTRQLNNLTNPRKTIISTNIAPGQLHEYYTERVASRIIGSFALFKFAGEDIRKLKR